MILAKSLMGNNTKPILPEEWNKLCSKEKTKRYKEFCAHTEEWKKLCIPTSLGDLVSIAIRYQVPIPTNLMRKDGGDIFEGYE